MIMTTMRIMPMMMMVVVVVVLAVTLVVNRQRVGWGRAHGRHLPS